MDSHESLFDIKDQVPITFGAPNFLIQSHRNSQTPDKQKIHVENEFLNHNLENTPCDEEQILRNQKLFDLEEHESNFFEQDISKEEEIKYF